ncbi:MAG TPA: FKBP-type peptidyl-prolyl cis-trans isomerase [Polyangiaceae bacterium]|nr:FKBP-type peptidyl-prolyl cis-trans isomerase [Polyangiaceae bacterium]
MTRTSFVSRRAQAALALVLLVTPAVAACKGGSSAADGGTREGGGPSASASATGLPAPPDVAAPPADAVKTADGLASKVLTPGTGADKPLPNDTVKVNYTGWTTDGKMFDSSVAPLQPGRRPQPAEFALNRVIPGWTEGVGLMVVGEKRRLWIPQELAYAGKPGAPAGMLVFDIELLGITPGPRPPANVAAAPADAQKTADGLASVVMQPGTGKDHPGPNDGVKVNYSIWTPDGKLLDASKEGMPMARAVTGMSDGWAEATQLMVTGEKRTFWVPAALGPKARPGLPPPPSQDTTMVIELVDILKGPKTPPDVKAPPGDAVKTASGLATKVLTKGTGTTHPTATSRVQVNYAGWTTDGKMFDSSYARGEPATFGLNAVIPGWTEAVQLMVEGEKRRIWVPEKLAYAGKPGAPAGMLVFEVELLKIMPGPPMGGPMMPPGMGGAMGGGPGGRPMPVPASHP